MTIAVEYPEIKNAFIGNKIQIINKSISKIRILKISTTSLLFSFKLSTDNITYNTNLYPHIDIEPDAILEVYAKADTTTVSRIITSNLINLEVEYV